MKKNNLNWAVVTGASSGIGLEFARIFAKNQTNLVLVARNVNALESLAKELKEHYKINILTYALDLSEISNAETMVLNLDKQKITPTYLINNPVYDSLVCSMGVQ
jgi:short-subunit dehydrogenase